MAKHRPFIGFETMHGQITAAGVAALQQGTPVILTLAKLGSDFNYIPSVADTDIHGSLVFSTTPSEPKVQNANIIRYSVYLDFNVGPFSFGECALFLPDGALFALYASDAMIDKKPLSEMANNSIKLEIFVSMVGENFDTWLDLAETNNKLQVPRINGIDQLPPPKNATPNIYVIPGADITQQTILAVTDRQGLWALDHYNYASSNNATVKAATASSVTIGAVDFVPEFVPLYFGQNVLQFTSSSLFGICRYVKSVTKVGNDYTLTFQTPLTIVPPVGATFLIQRRGGLSTTNVNVDIATKTRLGVIIVGKYLTVTPDGVTAVDLDALAEDLQLEIPIASKTELGAVIIGDYLTVDSNGLLSVDTDELIKDLGIVTSVNNVLPDDSGNVTIEISEVGKTGKYEDLIGAPDPFVLLTATDVRLGGVKVPADGDIVVDAEGNLSLGFLPVRSVDGKGGDVITVGSTELVAGTNLDGVKYPGRYFVKDDSTAATFIGGPDDIKMGTLEVIAMVEEYEGEFVGDFSQRWVENDRIAIRMNVSGVFSDWITIEGQGTKIATRTLLGMVIIGLGLNVDIDGVISTAIKSINGETEGDIEITAESLDAIPWSAVDQQGGVPGLSKDPIEVPLDPFYSDYIYRRTASTQLPLGGLNFGGDWDANTNLVNVVIGGTAFTYELLDNGLMAIRGPGSQPSGTVVPANGQVFKVSVGGATEVDNIGTWLVDDLILALGDRWWRIPKMDQRIVDFQLGVSVASEVIGGSIIHYTRVPQKLTLQTNAKNTAGALTTASAETIFDIEVNGTPVGGVTFDASSDTGAVHVPTPVTINPGDDLIIRSPLDTNGIGNLSIVLTFFF